MATRLVPCILAALGASGAAAAAAELTQEPGETRPHGESEEKGKEKEKKSEGEGYGETGFTGRVKTEVRYENALLRGAPDQHDLDVYQWVTLGTEGLGLENLETRLTGRFSKDLTTNPGYDSGANVWVDARDRINDDKTLWQLYSAYARLKKIGGVLEATLGRQYVEEIEWAHFDGVAAKTEKLFERLEVAGFFGRRAILWDDFSTKVMGGGHVKLWALPWWTVTVSDVAYARNSLGVSTHVAPDAIPALFGSWTVKLIEGDLARTWGDVDYVDEELGLQLEGRFMRQFRGPDRDFEFSYTIKDDQVRHLHLPDPEPFTELEGRLSKTIARPLELYCDLVWHRLDRRSEESAWEASFVQPAVGASLSGWPLRGFQAEARFTYAGYHRPDVNTQEVFDEELSGEGERSWFEVFVTARQRVGKALLVGVEYTYREFDYRSKLQKFDSQSSEAWRVFVKVDVGELVKPLHGLSVRVDYWNETDLQFVNVEDLKRAEGVWCAVEYSW